MPALGNSTHDIAYARINLICFGYSANHHETWLYFLKVNLIRKKITMSDKPQITLTGIDATDAAEYYTHADIVRFGYENSEKFSEDVVFVSFRVAFSDQAFPLRVWFKKSEAPEDRWLSHARKKAANMIIWTHEVAKEWLTA